MLLILTLLGMGGGLLEEACAQVLVYEMSFEKERGFNSSGFTGGYAVLPAGESSESSGSFIFTVDADGEKAYVEAADAASYFLLITNERERKRVVQASITAGDVTGGYVAAGAENTSVQLRLALAEVKVRLARKLEGRVVSSSSAANADNAALVGHALIQDWVLRFRKRLTQSVNRQASDVAAAVALLTAQLEAKGFSAN